MPVGVIKREGIWGNLQKGGLVKREQDATIRPLSILLATEKGSG